MRHPIRALILAALACMALTAEARDPKQVRHFRASHPCPATGKTTGACVGWVVDHVIPLCGGGLDVPENMQWQTLRASRAKDKREIAYCACLRAKKCKCEFKP